MQSIENNLYKAPQANLVSSVEGEHPILKFKRFTTWGVFLLNFLTVGLYGFYWLISRTKTANQVAEKKASMIPSYLAAASGVASLVLMYGPMFFAPSFFMESVIAGLGLLAVCLLSMIVGVFSLRNRLVKITNRGSSNPEKMGGIKTFLFHILFLNYRINKSIDKQSVIASVKEQISVEIKKAA